MKAAVSYRDDLLERLKNPRVAAAYLNECLRDEDSGVFLLALRDVAAARGGLRPLSKKTDLNREHLFRMLSRGGNPRLRSLRQIVDAIGLQLVLRPA